MTSPAHEDAETYAVGELAAELGVTTRTLRFYEEAGIVTPARTGSGAAREGLRARRARRAGPGSDA